MAEAPRLEKVDALQEVENLFSKNALLVIDEMWKMCPKHPSVLVDEILHSIFFLGEIHDPKYSPTDIVRDKDMLNVLKGHYPRPFKYCTSQLPRRSPMSCVLDMTVDFLGQEQEEELIKSLCKLYAELKKDKASYMVSSTICVSEHKKTTGSGKHYGVSMSSTGRSPGRVMTGAACLSSWDSYVAGAVMTYNTNKKKKSYFDGTIKMPESVRCEAFTLKDGKPIAACRSCANLFGLTTSDTQEWAYGNCAEAESLSNLLKKEAALKESVRPTSETYTEENIKKAKESTMKDLVNIMRMLHFKWDKNFYTPQIDGPSSTHSSPMTAPPSTL